MWHCSKCSSQGFLLLVAMFCDPFTGIEFKLFVFESYDLIFETVIITQNNCIAVSNRHSVSSIRSVVSLL